MNVSLLGESYTVDYEPRILDSSVLDCEVEYKIDEEYVFPNRYGELIKLVKITPTLYELKGNLEYCGVVLNLDNSIYSIDPSGGPFLAVGAKWFDFTIKAINDFNDVTETIDPDGLYKELYKLAQKWESEEGYKDATSVIRTNVKDVLSPEYKLYSDIMIAMSDLKNLDVRQQIKDSDKWLESLNVFRDGMEGLYTENPGNFKSQTLNQITASVSNVFQKVKDAMNIKNIKLRKLVKKLKQEKNYGYIANNLTGNPTSLYANMIEERNGDLVFVNPNTLQGAEKEFLEYALEVINKNRYPNDEANFESWKQNNDLRYYRVPLLRASTASKMSTSGNLNALKDRLSTWTIKGAYQELKERTQGFLSSEEEKLAYAKENIFKMNNVFDWGESDKRLDKIAEAGGVNVFEHNIEEILLIEKNLFFIKKC